MTDSTLRPDVATPVGSGLSRTIDLTRVSVMSIAWIVVLIVGAALRLFQLGLSTLSADEATRSFDAWSVFTGATQGPDREPATTAPTGLLLRSFAFFLFGDSDTTARIVSALAGIGIIGLIWSVRREVGPWRALTVAALAAVSPTLIYGSRTVNDEILALFFAAAVIVCLARTGSSNEPSKVGMGAVTGFCLAALIGSGPQAISLLVSLLVAFALLPLAARGSDFTAARLMTNATGNRQSIIALVVSFVASLLLLFTRFFSDLGALSGLGDVFADWGRLVADAPGSISTQFFVLSLLLYEIVAVIFAIKAALVISSSDDEQSVFDWTFPAIWLITTLVLFSFSSGRQPEHTVFIAFPLLMLGGIGLGDTLENVFTPDSHSRRTLQMVLIAAATTIALIATLILIGRVDGAADRQDAVTEVFAAAIVALGPLVVLAYSLADSLGRTAGWSRVRSAIFVGVALILGLLTIRSAVELSYYRQDEGTELLAQGTSVPQLREITEGIANLSRDINGVDRSPANPEGGKEMTIALDRAVEWPYRWYFRDFPNLQLATVGQASQLSAQLVIASDVTGMTEAGYQPRTINTVVNASPSYADPSIGTVLSHVFVPANWDTGFQYLLYRKGVSPAAPGTVTFGYSGPVVSHMEGERPTFGLFDDKTAGNLPGQFQGPRGVAVSPDGLQVYVLDTGNNRIEVFSGDTGELLGIWGDGDDPVDLALTESGLGPSGIATGSDGLVYVTDTWNHRIVVIDPDGQVVRTFAEFADNQDSPDPAGNPGNLFGPRGIAVTDTEVFVTDTGNERVAVYGLDGSFKRAFGGFGTEPGKLVEPVGVAVGTDGNVYVADSGNGRISVFGPDGAPVAQWIVPAWQGQFFYEPYLFANDDHIFASSPLTGSVLVYNLAGEQIDELTSTTGSLLLNPAGMGITPDGELLVADRGESQVVRIDISELAGASDDGAVVLPGDDASPVASPEASPIASPEASPAASPIAG